MFYNFLSFVKIYFFSVLFRILTWMKVIDKTWCLDNSLVLHCFFKFQGKVKFISGPVFFYNNYGFAPNKIKLYIKKSFSGKTSVFYKSRIFKIIDVTEFIVGHLHLFSYSWTKYTLWPRVGLWLILFTKILLYR